MGCDPGDSKVIVTANGIEKSPDSLNERLIAAMLDGVVRKESYAILALRNEVDAPPDQWRGAPIRVSIQSETAIICADFSSVVRGTVGANLIRIRAIGDLMMTTPIRPRPGPKRLSHPPCA